jgi:hypothetical protein
VAKGNICPCREFKPDYLVKALASQYTDLFRSKGQYFAGDIITVRKRFI